MRSCSWPALCGSANGQGGKRERDVAEVLDGEAEVDAGGFGGAMAEQIADRLERGALAEQVHRERVAQAVSAVERDSESALARPGLEYVADGGRLEDAGGSSGPKEHLPRAERRAPVAHIVSERF